MRLLSWRISGRTYRKRQVGPERGVRNTCEGAFWHWRESKDKKMETAKIEFATSRKPEVCDSGCEARALPTELRPRQGREFHCKLDLIYIYMGAAADIRFRVVVV